MYYIVYAKTYNFNDKKEMICTCAYVLCQECMKGEGASVYVSDVLGKVR